MGKARILVLGGCGFIGRNLVTYLISNKLAASVRMVDKVPPQVAWLDSKHQEVFADPVVEFRSANLINPESCESAFATDEEWDYVVNCACETKPGQTDPVYREGILKLSINCARAAAKHNVKHYVELSAGTMYSSEKTPHKENGPLEPWTYVARWKSQVETELKSVGGLRYTVLRPAVAYGLGDKSGLTPRLVIGAIYKQLGEMMKLLWDADMKLNTVHVNDLCKAIWYVCGREDSLGEIYNVVDNGNTTQGAITDMISELFNINHDYYGNIMSSIAKTDMSGLVEEVNDKHSGPWADACRRDGIVNTPLTPYMHEELLYHKHLNLDGTKLQERGFVYEYPRPTKELLQEVIDDYIKMQVFPSSLAP